MEVFDPGVTLAMDDDTGLVVEIPGGKVVTLEATAVEEGTDMLPGDASLTATLTPGELIKLPPAGFR